MLAYPITIDSSGFLALSSDPTRDQILALIDCLFFERVIFTDFGTDLNAFDPMSSDSISFLISSLSLSLKYWISEQIEVTLVPTNPELGTQVLQITYPESATPIQFNVSTQQVMIPT